MLLGSINASTTNNALEVMDKIETNYTLNLSQYMMSAPNETFPSFMQATTIILVASSGYDII